jgi:hypothetical protein
MNKNYELITAKPNTNQIIIDYIASTGEITKKEAEALYDYCVQVGSQFGTEAFDAAINVILEDLKLDPEELIKLTTPTEEELKEFNRKIKEYEDSKKN